VTSRRGGLPTRLSTCVATCRRMARSVASARCCVFVCTDIVMVLLWCSVSVAHQTNVNGNGLDMHASIWYLFTTMVLLEIIAELLLPGEAGAAEPTATSAALSSGTTRSSAWPSATRPRARPALASSRAASRGAAIPTCPKWRLLTTGDAPLSNYFSHRVSQPPFYSLSTILCLASL
jgi:hypothetical protein